MSREKYTRDPNFVELIDEGEFYDVIYECDECGTTYTVSHHDHQMLDDPFDCNCCKVWVSSPCCCGKNW